MELDVDGAVSGIDDHWRLISTSNLACICRADQVTVGRGHPGNRIWYPGLVTAGRAVNEAWRRKRCQRRLLLTYIEIKVRFAALS